MNSVEKAKSEFEGWPNYESWAVSQAISNDETQRDRWRQRARQTVGFAHGSRYLWDDGKSQSEAAACELADWLQHSAYERCPEIGPTVYAKLLDHALGKVNWLRVAEHILADIDSSV